MTKLDTGVLSDAKALWDFHVGDFAVAPSDFILAMGSHDERVATHAAELFLTGIAPLLVTSGGYGKVTRNLWNVPEGERFAEIAKQLGVPLSKIVVEREATNTGDNITKSRELLRQLEIPVRTGIIVTKPYMSRRAYATASKQWPDIKWSVSAPDLLFEEYPSEEVPVDQMINLMVGDLQRLRVYANSGFQIPIHVPDEVWASYERLRDQGFDKYVIREELH